MQFKYDLKLQMLIVVVDILEVVFNATLIKLMKLSMHKHRSKCRKGNSQCVISIMGSKGSNSTWHTRKLDYSNQFQITEPSKNVCTCI